MYTWIWRSLPGNTAIKVTEMVVLFLAVVALLMFVIFPWIEPHLALNQVTVPRSQK